MSSHKYAIHTILQNLLGKLYSLKSHQGFIRYFKNTSWMMAEQFLRIISGLFVGIWVARYLGPNQFGLFSYILAYTAIFSGIAKLGLDDIVVRELVNYPERRDRYLGTAFWLKVIGGLVAIILMAAVMPFSSNDMQVNLYILIIATGLLLQGFDVVKLYFQSIVKAKTVSICNASQIALSSVIKIYLVITKSDLIYFVLVTAFDSFSLAVSYYTAYKLNQKASFFRYFDTEIAKRLFKNSWPLVFSIFFIGLYMKIDQVMIGNLLGDREVGIYTAGINIISFFGFVPTVIVTSLFPAILSSKEKGEVIYKDRLRYLFSLMIYISLPLVIFCYLFSGIIIELTYGDQYIMSSNVLSLYSFSLPFMFLAVASSRWFIAEKLQILLLYRAILGAAMNIALNLLLIPLFGIFGAAISTILSYVCIALIFDFFNSQTIHIGLLKIKSIFLPMPLSQI